MIKTLKRIVAMLLVVVMVISSFPIAAFSATEYIEGNYTYTVSDSKATIVSYPETAEGVVNIPSTLGGYPVTAIGSYAFWGCTLITEISIPASITSIGNSAFGFCTYLAVVNYAGTEAQWKKISIGSGNSYLTDAEIVFTDSEPVVTEISTVLTTPKGGSVEVNFKDRWFESSNDEYSHELARFCSCFVMLGYSYNESEIKEKLKSMHFNVVDSNMHTGRDEVNYFIASKNIIVNGEKETLVFAAFIGSYNNQWYSNFDPNGTARANWSERNAPYATDSNVHLGFADAREYVYAKLGNFIKNNSIDKDKIKLLISGHSRGAATANLLAAKLIDEATANSSSCMVNKNDIYTYTFATPNTAKTSVGTNAQKYKTIFNIVNPEDFVTKVLLRNWGYGRYGETYTLPSKTNDSNYNVYLNKMRTYFTQFTGELYDPYKKGELKTYKMVKNFSENVDGLYEFYNKGFWYSLKYAVVPVYEDSYTFFKNTLLKYLVSKDMSGISDIILECGPFYLGIMAYFAWPDINANEVLEAIISDKKIMDGVAIGGKFEQAHQMETYCAYVNSLTESQVKQDRKGYENTVNCPVDIEVYDNVTNELVGRITDNTIDETVAAGENAIVMDVEGDSKCFWLPSNGDYRVVLNGNDEGKMDYTVAEINSDLGEIKRINFFDVEIENNVSMEGSFDSEETELEKYDLTHEDIGVIEPTEVITDKQIRDITIVTVAEGNGIADSKIIVTSGDYVTVSAYAGEDGHFLGWYEDGVLVSNDIDYSFVAKKDKTLVAKFTKDYVYTLSIQKPSRTEIRNKDGIMLHANVEGAPAGSYVVWTSSNGNFDTDDFGDGRLEIIAKNKGWTTFTATLCDADGNVLAEDTVEMYSKSGFFDKIGGFFRSLFGMTKMYDVY